MNLYYHIFSGNIRSELDWLKLKSEGFIKMKPSLIKYQLCSSWNRVNYLFT